MLTSLQNPLVKQMRKLHAAKERDRQQMFLVEGTHLVEEACSVGYPLEVVCCTPEWQERHPQLWQQVTGRSARTELVNEAVLKAIATTVQPDGVVAVAPRRESPIPSGPLSGLTLALETIQDPGNLGTLIRTAAATGTQSIWLSADSVDADSPKVLRASAGQWFRLPVAVSQDLKTDVTRVQQQGVQVISTTADAPLTYWEIDYCQPTLVLLGNEGAGLSAELLATANAQVRIPLQSGVESLNVAIAAALILYEAVRQQHHPTP
jgi:RNA methyltransferase, TrmH family